MKVVVCIRLNLRFCFEVKDLVKHSFYNGKSIMKVNLLEKLKKFMKNKFA